VGEGVAILGWVAVEPTPGPFAKETVGSAQFWSNKVLKNYKGKDEKHVNWANALVGFLQAFQPYIANHHTTGLKFNAAVPSAAVASASTASTSGVLADFDALYEEHFGPYLKLSEKIGDIVAQQAKFLETAVKKQRELIEHAGKTKPKPAADALLPLLEPIVEPMKKVTELKEKNRANKYFDHLSATGEACATLGWVALEPAPAPFAKETAGGAVFYTNKILKQYKGKEEDHVEWVKHLNGFFQGLEGYIKQYHLNGLSWGTGTAKPAAAAGGVATSTGGAEGDFQAIIDEHLHPYVDLSKKIGGPIADQAEAVKKAVEAEKELIKKAKSQKKPGTDAFQSLLTPISELMAKVSEYKEKNPKHAHSNHLSAVAEGIAILGWVAVEPAPGPFAKETVGSSEFWSNKILKEVRGKDETQENWVKSFNGFLRAFQPYIQQYHTTGLTWAK